MIPARLIRTVPEETTDEVERLWSKTCRLHPTWEHVTYREPLDPADWPMTGWLWEQCSSGAQKAGLIRLEAICRDGGFYIDSDLEIYRRLDVLRHVPFVAGWEDPHTVPDFFFAAEAGHSVFGEMLTDARVSLPQGAWQSGPGVFTRHLPGRPDVLLLPPGSFAPYHYNERYRRHENHHDANPWGFGAHHWAASWL
jgi:mannosyltransferase OCH1-like enzyme